MNDRIELSIDELMRERAKCRETGEALAAEREAHAATKRVVLGMMGAVEAHLGQLRAALERR